MGKYNIEIVKRITLVLLLFNLTGCQNAFYQVKVDDVAKQAERNEGSTAWAKDTGAYQRGNNKYFPPGTWKCNLFVHDMIYDAGIDPPPRTSGGWPITAAMWTKSVSGFTKVNTQARGDIVSNGSHVGIALGPSILIGANEDDVDKFKFKEESSLTIQRYNT